MNASTLVQKVWNFCHTLKGDLYEGLLQKNAEDTKSGAGQYFTPRALIEAMVACVRREPMKTIADPAPRHRRDFSRRLQLADAAKRKA